MKKQFNEKQEVLLDIKETDALLKNKNNFTIELHLFDYADNYIDSVYDANNFIEIIDEKETNSNLIKSKISLNYIDFLNNFNIKNGKFKIKLNIIENIVGDYFNNNLYINEISPSRKEIKIKPISNDVDNKE
jgi:hypothetical protein